MCDCFHLAFPNWHAASSGTGAGRRLRGPEPGAEDDSICDEPSQFTEGERPRPQGSSPVEEFPETEKYSDSECEAEHDPHQKSGSGKKSKKSGLGSMFEKRSTPKMSKLKELPSPESGVIVKTAKDGCAEGLVYGGGGKEGIFIKEVVPESPASKSLKLKEGDQILSATVYFDNMSYEDAMQILEHAQAYRLKLCLKRKPDITETEPTLESDVIPEEDVYAPEMREQAKTKRRGDARISWPKFPSFGKGKKSRFTRSHSSSEADEQRKLELSPTTSDTESPIKSQDALKGKKKPKIKLSGLKKRGRISSSEDQDTDTTGQISGKILQTHEASDMLSPECLESPSGERPEVYVTEGLKVVEDVRVEQNDQKLTEPQHKVELIAIDSTLKTEDLTVALADRETSVMKSPDGKKKKKERSELKMKILGKDKSHKKEAKAKSSPKRLKTLGASIEIPDHPEIPTLESHTKLQGDQLAVDVNTTQMEMSVPKVDPTFKLPNIGLSDIAIEDTIHKMNVNVGESTIKIEQLTIEGAGAKDPYDQLSKSSRSRTQLPKREEIEIPGMEDMSRMAAKGPKGPKAGFTGHYEELQAETVQLSIDVDSVKEAVSKLPGYKLPKVDTSGVPIPEDIIVIDANAQRISVKTPTKVVDTKKKQESHFAEFNINASPEISKTTVKLPKITPADITSEELLIETKVDLRTPEKKHKTKAKQSDREIKTEVYKREDIIIPGKESAQDVVILQTQDTEIKLDTECIKYEYESAAKFSPKDKKAKKAKIMSGFGITKPDIKIPDIGIDLPKQKISKQKVDTVKGEGTILIHEEKTEISKGKEQIGRVISDVKIPEIDGIEYIDSVGGSPVKKEGDIRVTGFGVDLDIAKQNTDIIKGEVKYVLAEEHTIKLPKSGAVTADISANVPDTDMDIGIDGVAIKTFDRDGKDTKFKMPNLDISMPKVKGPKIDLSTSKKDVDVTLPEAKAEIKLPEANVTLRNIDVSIPEQKMVAEKPELDIRPLMAEAELDVQGAKFKIPKFGMKIPKIKGPEFDLSVSKKEVDVTLTDAKAEGKLPEGPDIDVTLGSVDVSIQQQLMKVEKPELETKPLHADGELDGQGSRFKMPKLGIGMPKVKGPEIDFGKSNKDKDVTLPEAKVKAKLPDVELKETPAKVEIKVPELKGQAEKDKEGSPSKFKLPSFKLPKFGIATPDEGAAVDIKASSTDTEGPSLDVKTTAVEFDGKGSKFKMPKFGISLPKMKGPEIDLSLSKTDVDVTMPEAKAKLPDVEHTEQGIKVEVKAPEIDIRQDVEGSPSKFEIPTIKLPKFGIQTPDVSVGVGDVDKDVQFDGADIHLSKKVPAGNIEAPSVDFKGPLIDMKTEGTEHEGQEGTFKKPHLGFSMPKIKGPQINVSKKDIDVTLPEANVDVKVPEGTAELSFPEEVLELDGQGSKFKMPKLGMSMPKVKGPEIHFGLSKKDGDVTLPDAKAEVQVPELELQGPSAELEIKAPEIKVAAKGTEGSPSKFKMPTFKLPKFGASTPNVSVKVPEMDKDVKIDGADIKIPEVGSAVNITGPNVEIKGPSIDIKTTEAEQDGKGSKFKMPSLGFSMPKGKAPKIDVSLSKKDVDVTLSGANVEGMLPEVDLGKVNVTVPEAKAEVSLPEAPKIAVEMEPPEVEAEMDGQGGKFKMPKFGIKMPTVKGPEFDVSLPSKDVNVKLPETTVNLGKVEKVVSIPEAKMVVKKPEIEKPSLQAEGELDGQEERFKMPKFGIKMPKVKGPEFDLSLKKKDVDVTLPETNLEVKLPDCPKMDVSLGKAEVSIPEAKAKVEKPELEIKPPQADIEVSKFGMPKFGITMPKVKGPEFNLGLSKKDITLPEAKIDVNLPKLDVSLGKAEVLTPEAKVEVKKPEVEIKPFETDVEVDRQGGKFKMPKFGITLPKVKGPEIDLSLSKKDVDLTLPGAKAEVKLPEAPEIDVNLEKGDVSIPETEMDVEKPGLDIKPLQAEVELDGQGTKFKIPKFGISMPKVKGPETEFSSTKKDVDITLPEVKADVSLPGVEFKEPSAKVEIKAPEIEASTSSVKGSPSKFKMPSFKFPKFGVATPNVSAEVPDIDKEIKIDGAEMSISVPHTDVHVPEVKVEAHLPEVEVKVPSGGVVIDQQLSAEVDGKMKKSRFSLPKFSFSKTSVKAPEVDVSLPDVNVAIPEGKVELKGGEADIKAPESDIAIDGQGGKFKMPKFGITMPKVTGPDIDLSLSKKDVDVTLPEAQVDVKLPDIHLKEPSADMKIKAPEMKVETKDKKVSPSKFKMPTLELPKIGVGAPSATVEVPAVEKDIKIDGADIKIPEEVLTVEIAAPSIDTEGPSIHIKTTGAEHEGKGSKFKMPSLGFSVPQLKGPDIDLSLSKKDVDVKLPEAKAEVKLPDVELKEPSAKVEIKAPEIKAATKKTEVSPSKFKMPTFKLPKFGISSPSATVEVPDTDKDVKIDGADIKIPEEVLTIEIAAPSIDSEGPSIHMKTTGTEHEGKGSKFKMPSLGFSVPQVKQPDIDLSLSKKDVDVTLPEAKATVQVPDVEVKESSAKLEIQGPAIDVQTSDVDGSPSKFKMPTFKLPKFGAAAPQVSVEMPHVDKDIKVDAGDLKLPQAKAEVKLPDVEIKEPVSSITISQEPVIEGDVKLKKRFSLPRFSFSKQSPKEPVVDVSLPDVDLTLPEGKVEVQSTDVEFKPPEGDVELDAQESKFKMPKFGISLPKVKGPEIDLSLSKRDAQVTLPEAKVEIQLPDVGIKQPSAKVDVPDVGKDVKIAGANLEVSKGAKVGVKAPSIDTEGVSVDVKTKGGEVEGSVSKFKMPKFGISIPKVKGPEIDLSLSKKDVDVTLPEAKAEVQLPDVKMKQPSAKGEIKGPEIEVKASNVEGSPSKFKMPTFTLPKFGSDTPKVSVEVPDVDKEIKIDGAKVEVSKKAAKVDVKAPSIDTEGLSVDVTAKGGEIEGSGSKFKMPKFGISMPKVKGPEIDLSLSKKDVDVTLPEAKAEVQLPDVKIKQSPAKGEIKAPEIEAKAGNVEGSPSKFKMPTFTLPKFGAATPKVSVEIPDVNKDIKIDGAKAEVSKKAAKVDVKAPSIDTEGLSLDVTAKGGEVEGSGSKFKMPKFGISMPKVKGPEIDLSLSKKDVDVTLPEAKAEVQLPDVKIKQSPAKGEIKAPEIEAKAGNVEGSPSKFKMPTFTLPKFGVDTPKGSVDVPDVDKDIKIDGAKVEVSKKAAKVDVKAPSIDMEGLSVDVTAKGGEVEGSGSKFKMPKFGISMPKVKGPEVDLSLSKKDVDVTLPKAKAEVQLPDVKIKQSPAKGEIKAPEIEAKAGNVEGSPSKFKMPTFTLPKFGAATPKASVDVPDVDKDIKIDGAKVEVSKRGAKVDVKAPSIDMEGLSVDVTAKGGEVEGSGSKFKMPNLGISVPKVKGPEIDLSLSKKDVDVTMPEAKAKVELPRAEEPEGAISMPDVPTVEVEAKVKRPSWTFPRFSFSRTEGKASDVDLNLEIPKVDVTLQEAKAEVGLADIEVKGPTGTISLEEPPAAELEANLKKTKFSLPRLSFSKPSAKEPEISAEIPHVNVSLPEGNVEVKQPNVELKPPEGDVELDLQGSKFKMPKFGISMPKVKGPDIDLSLSKKDAEVTLPQVKAEVHLPDVKIKQPSAKGEIKAPEVEAQAGNLEGSPSKLKMPTFTLPKFGAATPKASVDVPDVDKDIKIDGAKIEVSKIGAKVDVKAPSIDTKVPKFKGPEIDIKLSKKDVDVTLPEAKAEVALPKAKETEGAISMPDAPTVEVEARAKRPSWTFPKFSFSRTEGKASDVDINLETPKVDLTLPEAKAEVSLPDVEVKGPPGAISVEEPPAGELDANLKKPKFSLPKLSFSKSSAKELEVSVEPPHVDVSLSEGEVKVKEPEVEIKAPELEAEHDGQLGKFKLPRFGIALPKANEKDLKGSHKDVEITLPEIKAEVKLPEVEVKSSANAEVKASETEAKSKDVGGSPLKFKMPTVKMPKFGVGSYDVTVEAPDADKAAETDGSKMKEDVAVSIKGPSVEIKTDAATAAVTDTETSKTDTDSMGLGSPSKFKLPSFKMPKLGFSRTKPEEEHVPVETDSKEEQLKVEVELKGESKSPKMTLTSFGEIFKNIDVEFDVQKQDKEEENLETSKDVKETDETKVNQLEQKEKETNTKQETTKSPERTGWFKFPKFGMSSPSEPVKTPEKDERKDEKSPVGETLEEEVSPTCSVQSSDAFADISSAMTSEHAGLSLSSPTKVTVKYSDPTAATGLGETHSIISSTTRTEVISVEPNLPEKITILSSGVSSSSEDTLQLASGKIHVITSNIQATPAAQHAKLLTDLQVQSAGDLSLKLAANEGASWTVEESQHSKKTVIQRHLVQETSSERGESKGTIVITKQITRVLDSSEPISGETASSIQRLRDSVHTDKMRFFDGAEK